MRGKHDADEPGPESAQRIGRKFGARHIDAHGHTGNFVLAQGHPGTTDARILHAVGYHNGQGDQREHNVVGVNRLLTGAKRYTKKVRTRNIGNPGSATENRIPVFEDDFGNRRKTQRHDGQIVAAQAQDREAQNHPEQHAHQAAERQTSPEAEIEVLAEQRVGISPDSEKGDIAEVKKSGQTDRNVQTEAKNNKDQRTDHHIDVVEILSARYQPWENQGDGRSAEQYPSTELRIVGQALRQRLFLDRRTFRMRIGYHLCMTRGTPLDRKQPEPGDGKSTNTNPDHIRPTPLDFLRQRINPYHHQRQGKEHEPQTNTNRTFQVRHSLTPFV